MFFTSRVEEESDSQ
jgi:hypothetical protein